MKSAMLLRGFQRPTSPDVVRDLMFALGKTFPNRPEFRHAEGNSAAHLKASAMGSSAMVIVEGGKLVLGTGQGIYFCEIDATVSRHCTIPRKGSLYRNLCRCGVA